MKLTAERTALTDKLSFCLKGLPSKATIPSTSCVLLATDGNGSLTLKTTNLDMTLTGSCEAEITDVGAVCVSAKRLAGILNEMSDDVVAIEADDKHQVKVSGVSCAFKLNGLPDDDFPVTPEVDGEPVELDGPELADSLAPVLHAVSADETRYVLNGVCVILSNAGDILSVATDGKRLAVCGDKSAKDKTGILPTATAKILAELASKNDKVTLTLVGNSATVEAGDRRINSKLIEGTYPNYKQVIPTDQPHKLECDVEPLAAAIARVSCLGLDTVALTLKAGKLTVSGSAPEIGSASETVAFPAWTGKEPPCAGLCPKVFAGCPGSLWG
jgi:DNA polymerase-3 subunit beta